MALDYTKYLGNTATKKKTVSAQDIVNSVLRKTSTPPEKSKMISNSPFNPNTSGHDEFMKQLDQRQGSTNLVANFGSSILPAFKTAGKVALELPKSLYQPFSNPSPTTRAVEQQQNQAVSKMPLGLINNPVTNFGRKIISRAFTPMVEGLGNEIGTFASDVRNPANLPQDSMQSFLNAANFGVAVGGTIKVLGEEVGTSLANKETTLRITPDQIQTKLANGEIKNPQAVKIAEELIKRNQSLEVSSPEPAGGLREKVGTALGGEIKPANPQFKFTQEASRLKTNFGQPQTLGKLNSVETAEMLNLDRQMNEAGRSNFKQSLPKEYKRLQELTLKTGDPSQFVDKTVLDAQPFHSNSDGTQFNKHEAGFASPQTIVTDIKGKISDAKSFIKETNKGIQSSKNLEDQLFVVKNNAKADKLVASDFLKNTNIPKQDAENIYHYEEDKSIHLTPQQQQIYDTQIKPLAEETNRIVTKLKPLVPLNSDTYTPRFVKNKGNVMDRLLEAKSKVQGVLGGQLNKSAPALKHRTMKAIVDEQGNRQIVSIKSGRVTSFVNKKRIDLGTVKFKTNEQLMNEDIKPVQKKIENLQRKLDGIKQVRISSPVSNAHIQHVQDGLQEIYQQMYAIGQQENIDLTDIKPLPSLDQVRSRESTLMRELKTLQSIKAGEELTNVSSRISAIQKKMAELSNAIADIEARYNPNELNGKKFVAQGGKTYKIAEATTKEIEQHTNLTYHKNVLANRVVTYLKLRQIERAVQFLDTWKASPDFSKIAMKFGEGNVPNGWRASKLPNFMGYAFEPHVAASLDDFEKSLASGSDPLKILTAVNGFLRTAIFFNPLIHVPNIGVHWLVNRGLTPFIRPSGYSRLVSSSIRAINAVIRQNSDYTEALRAGANLLYADENVKNLNALLLQKMVGEIEANPQLKFFKETFPNIIKFLNPYKISGKITWGVNDIAMMQAIYEDMDKGLSLETAIKEVGKHIPNYRIPATVLKSEAVAKVLKNPNITMFSAYHYGALNSYAEMAKQLVTGRNESSQSNAKNRADILDKLAMLALVTFVLYPQLDKLAKKATGNKNAFFRRAGATTFPTKTADLIKGRIDIGDYLLTFLTPAPGTKETLQELFNLDLFTGDKIRQPAQGAKADLKATGSHIFGQISPVQQYQRLSSGQQDLRSWLASLGGISSPKSTSGVKALQSMIYDEKPKIQAQLKSLYSTGKDMKAQKVIDEFNNRLKGYTIQAYNEQGQEPPTEDIIGKQYIKKPGDKAMQNFEDKKSTSPLGRLFP